MASIADLKPGGTIYSTNTGGRGTLTCFARKPNVKALYGVTARHVIPALTFCQIGNPNDFKFKSITVGGPAEHLPNMDALYFKIYPEVSNKLTESNFKPVGYTVEPLQVWDPQRLRNKIENAQSKDEQDRLKTKSVAVKHVGSTQMSLQPTDLKTPTPATLGKFVKKITNTQIAKGDSGGCVLHDSKQKYVGLISSGHQDVVSDSGNVIYLQDVFEATGLVLATWSARNDWLEPEPEDSDTDG